MKFIISEHGFRVHFKKILIPLLLTLSLACGEYSTEQTETDIVDRNTSSTEKTSATVTPYESESTNAPNFKLPSIQGPYVTRSEFEGTRKVLLVFYRAYW